MESALMDAIAFCDFHRVRSRDRTFYVEGAEWWEIKTFCELLPIACALQVCHEHILPRSHKVVGFVFRRENSPRSFLGNGEGSTRTSLSV